MYFGDNLVHSVLGMNKLYDGHEIFVVNIMRNWVSYGFDVYGKSFMRIYANNEVCNIVCVIMVRIRI